MLAASPRKIVIIGGGVSGAIMACHLLRDPGADLDVTIIEQRDRIGQGLAFSTQNRSHLLNVRAGNMSAFPDDPEHFWTWLQTSDEASELGCVDPFCFVPRAIYGLYMESLVRQHIGGGAGRGRLRIVTAECTALVPGDGGFVARLDDGASCFAHQVVLAMGHEPHMDRHGAGFDDPWNPATLETLCPDAAVLIVGTGLTMVDFVISAINGGHQGPILAISRRGLLPHPHLRIARLTIDAGEVPRNATLGRLTLWLRDLVRHNAAAGGDWRSVVDGLRPHSQAIWQDLGSDCRRRFSDHARAWWDIHRHRMAPEVDERLKSALASGQLRVLAAKLVSARAGADGYDVSMRRRGVSTEDAARYDRIVDCRGLTSDPRATSNPLRRSLLDQGLARPDPLHIGLDIASDCSVIDAEGRPSGALFAIGPLTRARFWEIIAVPDIRVQCARLARDLCRAPAGSA